MRERKNRKSRAARKLMQWLLVEEAREDVRRAQAGGLQRKGSLKFRE